MKAYQDDLERALTRAIAAEVHRGARRRAIATGGTVAVMSGSALVGTGQLGGGGGAPAGVAVLLQAADAVASEPARAALAGVPARPGQAAYRRGAALAAPQRRDADPHDRQRLGRTAGRDLRDAGEAAGRRGAGRGDRRGRPRRAGRAADRRAGQVATLIVDGGSGDLLETTVRQERFETRTTYEDAGAVDAVGETP